MIELTLVIIGLIAISFLCSVLEAVILSISRPFIETLIDKKSNAGQLLKDYKNNIEEPISAILTLNTISHTMGATVSGALALNIFGSQWMALFSGVLTLVILIFSEIIPKTIGAHYWKQLSPASAYILKGMIIMLKPLIIPINFLSSLLTSHHRGDRVSKPEIYNFFKIGYNQGVFDKSEYNIMDNLFRLRDIKVKEIMTPRTVVTWLDEKDSIGKIKKSSSHLNFSRLPLYDPIKNKVSGFVLRRDIMNLIAEKKSTGSIKTLKREARFVPGTISALNLLTTLVSEKNHLAIVLNEYGDYIGIVTLEDAIETLLGKEIVDEFDPAVDMRKLAQKKRKKK